MDEESNEVNEWEIGVSPNSKILPSNILSDYDIISARGHPNADLHIIRAKVNNLQKADLTDLLTKE